MHSKQKGVIGVWAVAKHLAELNLAVFIELSDLSKTDLIVDVAGKLVKVQVKSVETNDGVCIISLRKSASNYTYHYTVEDVDVFAVYVRDRDAVIFVSSSILLKHKSGFSIRFDDAKNNQKKIHHYSKFLDFYESIK